MTGSKRRKGNRSRLKAISELQAQGWIVDVVEKTSKWAKIKDCFGLFDIIAIHPEKGIMLIQISTNTCHPQKDYIEFASRYSSEKIIIAQWVWKDRKGFEKYSYEKKKSYQTTKILYTTLPERRNRKISLHRNNNKTNHTTKQYVS